MKTDLTKHIEIEDGKTRAESIANWVKAWENSRYLLRPLLAMFEEKLQSFESIKESDFDCPNHYAKVAFKAGKRQELQDLIDLLPKTLKD